MKKILFISLCICCFIKGNAADISFSSTASTSQILCKLFNGHWSEESHVCIWNPNVRDSDTFNIAKGSTLYSKVLDTFVYKTSQHRYKILICGTYEDEECKEPSCHPCGPSISYIALINNEHSNAQILSTFKRSMSTEGHYGFPGLFSLFQLTENDYAIKMDLNHDAQGYYSETSTLFYNGNEILNYCTHCGITKMSDLAKEELYEYKTTVKVDITNGKLNLLRQGTQSIVQAAETKAKKLKVKESINYKFNNGKLEKI